jgi:hypothetical protein
LFCTDKKIIEFSEAFTPLKGYVRSTCNFSHRVNFYDGWRTRFTISPTID